MVVGRFVRSGAAALIALVAIALATRLVDAQGRFDVQQFTPLPAQSLHHVSVSSARVLDHGGWEAGFLLSYADEPLVLVSTGDERVVSIVGELMTLDIQGAVGVFDRLEIGVDIPVILLQQGDDAPQIAFTAQGGFDMGDIRVVGRALLFTQESPSDPGGAALGLSATASLPTGDERAFQGEGFRVEPRLAFDYAFSDRARLSANLGYLVRPESRFENIEVDDTLTFGLASSIAITRNLLVVPQVVGGASVLAKSIDIEELPLEVLLGFKYFPVRGLLLEAGAGTGLVEGFGTPDWRVFFGVHISPPGVRDRDGDGVSDGSDACPLEAEDADGFEDADGCPDLDHDRDSIPDRRDACPLEPEDLDDVQDADGCPEPDREEA